MTITRATVRAAAVAALQRYIPGVPVLVGQAWPTYAPQAAPQPSILLLSLGNMDMRARGNSGPPSYDVRMVVTVRARLALAPNAYAPPDTSPHGAVIEAAADQWGAALRDAMLGDPDFNPCLGSGDARIEYQLAQGSESGEQLLLDVAFTVECQWIEEYPPRLPDNLTTFNLRVDAIEPFDAAGTYAPAPPFPDAAAAPREAGPDGRAEAGLTITFPNP